MCFFKVLVEENGKGNLADCHVHLDSREWFQMLNEDLCIRLFNLMDGAT